MNQLKCAKIEKLCKTFAKHDIEIEQISIGNVVSKFLVIQCCFTQEIIKKHFAEYNNFTKDFISLVNSILYGCGFHNCEKCEIIGSSAVIQTDIKHDDLGYGLVFSNPKYADQGIQPYLVNADGSTNNCELIGLAESKRIELQDRFDLLDMQ